MRNLSWLFALRDGFSVRARGMTSALGRMRSELRNSARESTQLSSRLRDARGRFIPVGQAGRHMGQEVSGGAGIAQRGLLRMVAALQRVGTASSAFDQLRTKATNALTSVKDLFSRLTSLPSLIVAGAAGLTVKSFFDAVGFKEQQLVSFNVMLRPQFGPESRKAAQQAYSMLNKFAAETPFETAEVIMGGKQLLAAGVRLGNLKSLLKDAGDLAAGMGVRLEEAISPLARLRSGNFGEAFERLRELGISRRDLEGAGLEFDKQGSYVGSVEMAMGKVRQVIRQKFGGMMEDQSKTIFGLVSTLKSRPFELFSQMDVGDDSPLYSFKKMLNNLASLTDFSQGPGKTLSDRFHGSIENLMDAVFGPLADATEPLRAGTAILSWIDKGTAMVNRARQIFPVALGYARQFWTGVKTGLGTLQGAWEFIRPGVEVLGGLTKSLNATKAGMEGGSGSALVLAGTVAALFGAWTLLNLVTFGGAGALLRWAAVGTATVVPAIWRMIAGSNLLTAAKARLAVQSTLMGLRMAAAWLVGIGPIGWVILGITGVVAAVVAAYNRFSWFRDGVNNAWAAIVKGGAGFLSWVQRLPGLILAALQSLPAQMAQAGVNAVTGLWNGLKSKLGGVRAEGAALGNAAAQGTQGALQVRSPSRRMAYLGRMGGAGLESGLTSMRSRVGRAGSGLAQAAMPAALASPAVRAKALPKGPLAATGAGCRAGVTINFGDVIVPQAASPAEAKELLMEAVLEALEAANYEVGDGA